MIIAEAREICKSALERIPRDTLLLVVLVLVALLSFGLGFLVGVDAGAPARVILETAPTATEGGELSSGQVVASQSGTKYYFTHCSGASRISDANKIWFTSAAAAERAGYTLAANCRAL